MSKLRKEAIDQTAHLLVAGLIVGLAYTQTLAGMMTAGFIAGTVREVTELGLPVTLTKIIQGIVNSPLDLTFWTLGGAVVWAAVNLIF